MASLLMAAAPGAAIRLPFLARRGAWAALAAVFLFFTLLKLAAQHPDAGDHNIYFYLAARTAAGLVPYRDFVFAHPPLHLLPMAVVAALTGGSALVLKAMPGLWALLSAACLFLLARQAATPRPPAGRDTGAAHASHASPPASAGWTGVLAAALFLFSFDVLRISSEATGPNQSTALLLLAICLAQRGRHLPAGACAAASVSTTLFVAPLVLFIALPEAVWSWRRRRLDPDATSRADSDADAAAETDAPAPSRRRSGEPSGEMVPADGSIRAGAVPASPAPHPSTWRERLPLTTRAPAIRWFAGAAAAVVLIHLPAWVTAPAAWWRQTVMFHLRKPAAGRGFMEVMGEMLGNEGMLLVAAAAWLLLLAWRRDTGSAGWLPAAGMAHIALLAVLMQPPVFLYYLYPALPFLALGTALLVRAALRSLLRRRWIPAVALLAALAAGALLQGRSYLDRPGHRAQRGRVVTYAYRPVAAAGRFNALLDLLMPEQRTIGRLEPAVWRYLWREQAAAWIDPGDLAARISSRLGEHGVLFGDSYTAPLLALLSGRRLACERADTNTMQYLSGMTSLADDLDCVRRAPETAIVVLSGRGLDTLPPFRRFLEEETELLFRTRAAGAELRVHLYGRPVGEPIDNIS